MTRDPLLCIFILCFHGVEPSFHSSCSGAVCNGVNISYPFWLSNDDATTSTANIHCGYLGFGISCPTANNTGTRPILALPSDSYYVKYIDYSSHSVTLIDIDVVRKSCPRVKNNVSIGSLPLDYSIGDVNITFYFNCSFGTGDYPPPASLVPCFAGYMGKESYVVLEGTVAEGYDWSEKCEQVVVATVQETEVSESDLISQFAGAMRKGFVLGWDTAKDCGGCEATNGRCGFDNRTKEYLCFCHDGSVYGSGSRTYCKAGNARKNNLPIKIVIGVAVGVVIFVPVILYLGKRLRPAPLKGQKSDQNIENFINQRGSLAPKRFSYSQVKRMTDSFGSKLGQGGFGAVYRGKLPDGTLVAVKLLNASKGNGEEFINEVASISRTSHVNIVALLGFCYEGHRRALIYEFMSNRSLDKFIHDENALRDGTALSWDKLYQIAVGIARGLEYLHRGCSTRILHFDIKPQNILLDNEFRPKISDFGLSKLCLNRESIVSMLAARGTVGYIAPEVFSRNFGGVSHKSDVYSYGMMLLEMVGGRKNNLTDGADRSSEVYFHDQVYQLIEDGYDRGLYRQLTEEDKETARKMAMVGVWCIQTGPKQRPSMGRVIEMFEGSTAALPIPPKPFLFSPPRQMTDSLSISVSMWKGISWTRSSLPCEFS